MSVHLEPASQLSFKRPLTQVTKELLLVTNPSNDPVMFKIKTTAPKQYCVRPNAGRVEPNSHVEVQVILQPFKEEPPLDYKCKDKFLVQTAVIKPAYEALPITDMWARVEQEDKAGIFQQKIKCAYLPPEEDPYLVSTKEEPEPVSQPTPAAPATAASVPPPTIESVAQVPVEQVPPAKPESQPEPVVPAVTATPPQPPAPKQEPIQLSNVDQAPEPKPRSALPPAPPVVETKKEEEEKPKPVAAPATSVAPAPAQDDSEKKQMQEDLRKARDLVAQLQKQIATLQKEQEAKGGRKLPPTVQPQDAVHQHLAALEKPQLTEGYPPQVVLIVAAVVFVFTYLFF
ncbi:PapD-like protein [Fennellomyces sp. T-0311]|nr:PapD-like protein [Fennellomyces sp. T-0311]